MSRLIQASLGLLERMYSPERGLFSATASMHAGRLVNDFEGRDAIRYTINVLAGLQAARAAGTTTWAVDETLDRFLRLHGARVTNQGDQGLLRVVLADAGRLDGWPAARAPLEARRVEAGTLQEASWLLFGLTRQVEQTGDAAAASSARRLWLRMQEGLWNAETCFPYHTWRGKRRRLVSFGGITYFLQALAEYARVMQDGRAGEIFATLTGRLLALQGPRGEWGWFYDAHRGRLVEWYEIYTVHQCAMAPLFLLPAHDLRLAGAEEALRRGYQWAFGANELGVPMVLDDPFFTYRSIRRRGPRTRERRLARAVGRMLVGTRAVPAARHSLEVNPECRSYEIGWLVYSWTGRTGFEEFTDLTLPRT